MLWKVTLELSGHSRNVDVPLLQTRPPSSVSYDPKKQTKTDRFISSSVIFLRLHRSCLTIHQFPRTRRIRGSWSVSLIINCLGLHEIHRFGATTPMINSSHALIVNALIAPVFLTIHVVIRQVGYVSDSDAS